MYTARNHPHIFKCLWFFKHEGSICKNVSVNLRRWPVPDICETSGYVYNTLYQQNICIPFPLGTAHTLNWVWNQSQLTVTWNVWARPGLVTTWPCLGGWLLGRKSPPSSLPTSLIAFVHLAHAYAVTSATGNPPLAKSHAGSRISARESCRISHTDQKKSCSHITSRPTQNNSDGWII